jgi:organic radical activating enzyme
LHTWGWHTEIETAGTIAPKSTELCKLYTVSPKLKNSGNPHDKRYKPDVLRLLNESGRAVFKFVVSDWQDFDEIDDMVEDLDLKQVYIMPEGTDPAKITYGLEALAAHCIERGYHISTRLQVMIYGNKRGV